MPGKEILHYKVSIEKLKVMNREELEDEYDKSMASEEKTYYHLAHSKIEPVKEQPRMLVGGRLKEYQVNVSHANSFKYS